MDVVEQGMNEMQLFQKMKAGDESAFDQLFQLHYEHLVNFAYRKTYDQSVAKDIVQNVFIEFWKKKESWNIERSVLNYLKKTINSRCIDHFRKETRMQIQQDTYVKQFDLAFTLSPEEELLSQENLQAIYDKIEALPPKCKIVFKLSRFENKSYQEIADELNVSKKTIEYHMHTALQLLRKMIFFSIIYAVS